MKSRNSSFCVFWSFGAIKTVQTKICILRKSIWHEQIWAVWLVFSVYILAFLLLPNPLREEQNKTYCHFMLPIKKEEAPDTLLWKDERRRSSSTGQTLELFQRQLWEDLWERQWNTYGPFRVHRYYPELNCIVYVKQVIKRPLSFHSYFMKSTLPVTVMRGEK